MGRVSKPITANEDDVIILKKLSCGADSTLALRANIILKCLESPRNKDVAAALSIDERSVALWKERFRKNGILGLSRVHRGGKTLDIDLNVLDAAIKHKTDELDNWTIKSLADELGVSEHVVKVSLTRQGIQRRRLHSWTIDTSDEIISKYIDIRGLYITNDTRAIIICSSNALPEVAAGSFTTKNRILANDLAGSVETITLADVLVAAKKHCPKRFSGKFETLNSFLSDVIVNFNGGNHSEWHVFLKGSQKVSIKGTIDSDIHIEEFESDSDWLSQVKGWIASTYETSRFDQIGNLFTAIENYIKDCTDCTDSTEPFLWKKKNIGAFRCSAASNEENKKPSDKQLVSQSVERLISKMESNPTDTQMGALLILRDKEVISLGEAVSETVLPSSEAFDFSTQDSMGMSIGKAEAPILSFAREMELQMLKMYIENTKKNKAD